MKRNWLYLISTVICLMALTFTVGCWDDGGSNDDVAVAPGGTAPAGWESDFIDGTFAGAMSGTGGDGAFTLQVDQNKHLMYGAYNGTQYTGTFNGDFNGVTVDFDVKMTPKTDPTLPDLKVHFDGNVSATGGAMSGNWVITDGAAGNGTWSASR